MDTQELEAILEGCEQALSAGGRVGLRRLGFWRAVAAVKRRPDRVQQYADRIGAIDRAAFERAVQPTFRWAWEPRSWPACAAWSSRSDGSPISASRRRRTSRGPASAT